MILNLSLAQINNKAHTDLLLVTKLLKHWSFTEQQIQVFILIFFSKVSISTSAKTNQKMLQILVGR